jgi:outer membrane protein assembly factor BamE
MEAQRLQCFDHIATPQFMSDPARGRTRFCLCLAAAAALGACASPEDARTRITNLVSPYQIDVVQGNFVSSEQVGQLKPGMGRLAVRDLLGTPLLQSVFHADRWDYVFTFKRKGEEPQLRKVTIFFKGDVLERFDADALPTEAEFVASLNSGRKAGKIPELEASEESLKQFPPVSKATEAKALPPPRSSYPPLEPASP